VRIALELKGVAWENVPVHLLEGGGQQHSEAHKVRNAMEQVPVLEIEHEGRTVALSQSIAILEYLEERYPEPALLPEDAWQRARVRMCVEIVNSGVQPLQNLALLKELKKLGADEQAFAKRANERGLAALEVAAKESASRFLVGDAPTFADVCLVPQLYSARRFGVDLTAYPELARVEAALAVLPAFDRAHPDRQSDAVVAPNR
jgi:maleylpyruvate isomerase